MFDKEANTLFPGATESFVDTNAATGDTVGVPPALVHDQAHDHAHANLVTARFSRAGSAAKWKEMYDSETPSLEEQNFRDRCDFTVTRVLREVDTGARVLDVGCGSGPVLARLRQAGVHCMGMDYAPDMLELARERLRKLSLSDGEMYQGDIRHTAFPDAYFDAIVCLGVISYVEDYSAALREILRLLKPNGLAIVSSRSSSSPVLSDPVTLARKFSKTVLGRDRPEPYVIGRFMQQTEVTRKMIECGFRIEQFEGIGFGPLKFNGWAPLDEHASIRLSRILTTLFRALRMKSAFRHLADVNVWVCRKPTQSCQ